MLGDILLIEDKHRIAGEAIIQKILEKRKISSSLGFQANQVQENRNLPM
jgi:hypothetical protein